MSDSSSDTIFLLLPSLYSSTRHSNISGLYLYKLFYKLCSEVSDTKELTAFFKNFIIVLSSILNKVHFNELVLFQSIGGLDSVSEYVNRWEELRLFSKRLAWISTYYNNVMGAEHDQKLVYFELRCVKLPTLVEVYFETAILLGYLWLVV